MFQQGCKCAPPNSSVTLKVEPSRAPRPVSGCHRRGVRCVGRCPTGGVLDPEHDSPAWSRSSGSGGGTRIAKQVGSFMTCSRPTRQALLVMRPNSVSTIVQMRRAADECHVLGPPILSRRVSVSRPPLDVFHAEFLPSACWSFAPFPGRKRGIRPTPASQLAQCQASALSILSRRIMNDLGTP
jgi:hypothetical protein